MKTLIKTWSFWFIVVSEAFNFTLLVFADNLCAAIWSALAAYWVIESLLSDQKNIELLMSDVELSRQLLMTTMLLKKYTENERKTK